MPLNGTARGDANFNAMSAANPNFSKLSPSEQATMKSGFETLYTSDTTYLTTNAVIPSTVVVASVSGVTTGPGVSGPGEGTGTGTLT